MGKKAFIDKKNSATFKLFARDTSTLPDSAADYAPSTFDRVFVRIDNNPFHTQGIFEDNDGGNDQAGLKLADDFGSIFADAPGDTDEEESSSQQWPIHSALCPRSHTSNLLSEVRKEILELGLPDDGYNYLQHLREISNAGAGSAYYQNSKARLDLVPLDVKAFDASRVKISEVESNKNSMYDVASKTVGVKIQKAVDPDVARLLDDNDLSRFGSDTEDLEEDFVVMANLLEGNEGRSEEVGEEEPEADEVKLKMCLNKAEQVDKPRDEDGEVQDDMNDGGKPRIHRLLDEQFDLLTLREYDDTCSEDDGYPYAEVGMDDKPLVTLKNCKVDDFEFEEQYRAPGDSALKEKSTTGIQLDDSTDIIRRCRDYAEKYCFEGDEEELMVVEESSDESEVWDCETIVSTYSNLDNHPGKIQAPLNLRRKVAKMISADSLKKDGVIELRGKEKLPAGFFSPFKKDVEKPKKADSFEKQKCKTRKDESKEEKRERKVIVKEERREARRAKKELKGLYTCEAHKAQKVAALSLPSAIHIIWMHLLCLKPYLLDAKLNVVGSENTKELWQQHLLLSILQCGLTLFLIPSMTRLP